MVRLALHSFAVMPRGPKHSSDGKALSEAPTENFARFTNREREQQLMRDRIHAAAGSRLPMLMFYGVAGQGKTWLLRRLQSLVDQVKDLPLARIDFDGQSSKSRNEWLASIRRQLGGPAPRFDLTRAVLSGQAFEVAGQPGGAAATAADVGESAMADLFGLIEDLPAGAGFLAKALRLVGGRVFAGAEVKQVRGWLKSEAGRSFVQNLAASAGGSPDDLAGEFLLGMLALDLAEFLPRREDRACRAVVFLDTFEHLKRGGLDATQQIDERERWIYELWEACHEKKEGGGAAGGGHGAAATAAAAGGAGEEVWCPFLQIAIAGRDRLLWEDRSVSRGLAHDIRETHGLETHLIGGLSKEDAEAYLTKCQIHGAPLREAILRVSRDLEAQDGTAAYHAFALGLCADTVFAERAQHGGQDPDPATFDALPPGAIEKLAERFLTSLASEDVALKIRRLAATSRFDGEALAHQFSGEGDADKVAVGCRRILRFSFVEPLRRDGKENKEEKESGGGDWYRLHPLMSEALEGDATEAESADRNQYWETYWTERSHEPLDDAASLAWYHQWRRDPLGALEAWKALAESLRGEIRMVDHAKILEWWEPTGIEKRKPRDEGEAAALVSLGIEYQDSSLGTGAENFARAVAAYHNALEVYTREDLPRDWAMTWNNLGNALSEQGRRTGGEAGRKLQEEAEAAYRAALEVYTREDLPQDWATTQNNLGAALQEQGLRTGGEAGRKLLEEAEAAYRAALEVRTREDLPQDWAMTQNNLGAALREWAGLDGKNRKPLLAEAIAAHRAALEVWTAEHFSHYHAIAMRNLVLDYALALGGEDRVRELYETGGPEALQEVLVEYFDGGEMEPD